MIFSLEFEIWMLDLRSNEIVFPDFPNPKEDLPQLVKEGYFIKLTSATTMKGNMEMTSPQAMAFPIVIEMKGTNEVK